MNDSLEARLQTTLNMIPAYTWYAAPAGALTFVNERCADYLGLPKDHPLRFGVETGAPWDAHIPLLHPDDQDESRRDWSTCLATGSAGEFSFRVRNAQGTYRWFLSRAEPLRAKDGTLLYWVGINLDIEERKQAELYLAEGQRLAHTGSWAFNAAGFEYWSSELFRIHGLDPSGKAPTLDEYVALVHPEDREFVTETIRKMFAEHRGFDFTKRIVRPDGEIRRVRCVGNPATHAGAVGEFIGTGMDVTEHELLTQELRRREAYLAEAQRLSHTGSFGWKPDTGEIIWSAETYRIFEYDRAVTPTIDLVAQRVHPEDRADFQSVIERASGGAPEFEHAYRLLLPDGRVKHVHALAHATQDASGNREFVGAVTDVTDQRQAEESLRESESYLAEAQKLSHTGSWAWSPGTDVRYWSEECYRVLGFDPRDDPPRTEELIQRIHPDDRPAFRESTERAKHTKLDEEVDYRIVHPGGAVRDIHSIGHPVFSPSGDLIEFTGTVIDITERKRAEEELRRSEAYLSEAQKLSHTGSWAWSPDQDIRYWSEECYRVLSFDPQDGLPRFEDFFRRLHRDDQPGFRELIQTAIREKAEWEADYRIVHPDGLVRDIHVLGHPVLSTSGHLVEFVGTVIDVTEQKRAEEELRRSRAYLAEAQKVSHTGSWAWNNVTRENVYWSEECFRIHGRDPAQGLPSLEQIQTDIHPDDVPGIVASLEKALREGREWEGEYRLINFADGPRTVRSIAHPVPDRSGRVVEYIGTVVDVTDQKRAEEQRKEHLWFLESMDRINRAMQRTNDVEGMMSSVLEETRAIFGSDRAWLVYPCDPDAATSRVVMEHTRPEYPGAFALGEEFPVDAPAAEILGRVLDGPGAVTDLSILPEMRERFSIQSVIAIAVRPKGDRPYVFGLHQCSHARAWTAAERRLFEEIARRLEDALTSVLAHRNLLASQQELRTSEQRFRTFVDFAADAFVLHSEDGTILDVNRQACESTGYTREELIGNNIAFTESDMDRWREHWRRLRERVDAGEVFTYETRARRKDGTAFPVEVRVRPFRYGDQTLYIALSRDIGERKQAEAEHAKLEERLRQTEKMEAIGRFSSGIAHDFNNVLGGIIAYGEMLFDDAPESSPRQRYAKNVLTAATRGRDLVGQLLAYTRSQRGKRRPTDVCRSVAETLDLVRSSLPASITLHATIPDAPLVVMGDATQLHQVVMNLCSNAIHAMSESGSLRVTIAPQDVAADLALSHGTLRSGRYALVSVEDSGCGMDEATLARIFEPFFTTKEVGRGTGLGLALVYAIVADFGGVIDVKSAPEEGSTFSIYIPMADVRNGAVVTPEVAGR